MAAADYAAYLRKKYDMEEVQLRASGIHPTFQVYDASELDSRCCRVCNVLAEDADIIRSVVKFGLLQEVYSYAACIHMVLADGKEDLISLFDTHSCDLWDAFLVELHWSRALHRYPPLLMSVMPPEVKAESLECVDVYCRLLVTHPSIADQSRKMFCARRSLVETTMKAIGQRDGTR